MMPTAELANQFQTNNPPEQTYLDRLVQNIIVPDNPRLIDAYVGEVWASTEQPSYMQAAARSENVDLFDPRYAAMPCIEALQLPDASRVSVAAEKNSVNNFLYHIKNTATAIKDGYMEARKPAVVVVKSVVNLLTHPLRELPEALSQVTAMNYKTHLLSRGFSKLANNIRSVGDGFSLVTDKAAVEIGLLFVACGPMTTKTEPAAQPPTQAAQEQTAQPTTLSETAAPPTTGAEAAASPTPSYSDANGGNYSPEVRSIVDQQSESLTSRLIDGRYIAGRSNLEREYSPEAGLIFAKIIGAPIEHYDIEGNLIASYPPGTRVMESQIQGNEGELLFFGPAGVNNSRRAAGLSEIPEDQMVFKLTTDGIPYALTLDGVPLGSVMPTSNPDVAPWIPPEVLAVNPSIRVIKPVTEGQEWPRGGFDETGQNLLAQMDQGGGWIEVSAEAIPKMGEIRTNAQTGQTEYFFDEWVTSPVKEGFDPAHIVLENNQIHYRSEGLTQIWSAEQLAWVFPDVFPYKVGEVVPVSIMGGQLEIADQAAAWKAHQDMVLAWLNNQGNAEFLQAVYGKTNIGWEDLRAADESGQTKYEINLIGLNGEMIWPEVIIISNTGDVRYWTLADYIDDKATFGTKIDVSSPLWIVAGPDDWESGGVREFADKFLDGPDIFGVSWAKHGLRFTREGRIVWEASSRNLAPKPEVGFIVLGEQPTLQDNARLWQAYLASTINTFEKVNPHTENTYPIPFFASAGIPGITVEDVTGINSFEEADSLVSPTIFSTNP